MDETINKTFKSGFVALLGRPNAGKSTLINTLIGQKIAITSDVSQTTRHRIFGILNKNNMQAIFVDTPGIHKPKDVLGQELNEGAYQALNDCDIACMLIDLSKDVSTGDKWVANKLQKCNCSKFCILTKSDLVSQECRLKQFNAAKNLMKWDSIIILSSLSKYNINALTEEIFHFLPEGPRWYPKDTVTDQDIQVLIAEFIREKVLSNYYDEIPHAIGVDIDDIEYIHKKNLYKIYSNIYVEQKSQKGIIIGKEGNGIKLVGVQARKDLENLLDAKVYLDIQVKIKKNWRKDYNQIRKFGYTQE